MKQEKQNRFMRSSNGKKRIGSVWIFTVIISAVLIVVGNLWASKDAALLAHPEVSARAKVTELTFDYETKDEQGQSASVFQYFNAKILSGPNKGRIVQAYQQFDSYNDTGERLVKAGDKVILYNYGLLGNEEFLFGSFARFDNVAVLGIAYLVLVVCLGKKKGLNTIISLIYTCAAVFLVFLPSVASGKNIYLMTVLICIFTIIMTLLVTNGATKKSFTTMLGCAAGVMSAAVLSIIFDKWMHLTGMIDEHSVYIKFLREGDGINLKALIFAMITIGAMGAVMDVAMDIASALNEIKLRAPDISKRELFKSGLNIGRDVMGTMANTLVLAYIGSSLCTIILRASYAGSLQELLHTESIAVEILQALIGSLGILLTIPLTALICCIVYNDNDRAELTENN